ncbi:G patch domain-containing protein 8-like isoform X2 [Pecten maximus]|nr:G patch domain-containing protein 8-like isoform X2 [Pecten maximus]
MPPLESFMGIAPMYCREHFFNSLEKRDLVVGVVSSVMESGVVVTLLCMDGGKVRDIDELKTTAFCPVKELPRLFANQSPIEGFQVKDKVRGVVLNVNQETEKVIVSMVERSLPEELSHIKLGLINEDDFPVHYRRKLHIRGLAFDELLHSILGFNNSGNVSSLLGLLHLSESTSIMRGLHRKNIPEKEYAESLRKYQSQKWAHQSVANGVAMFKAGKQVEAMQYLNKALQIDNKNVEALVARGALYANNESYTLAIEDFELALEVNSQHMNARKYLYETLLALAKVLEDRSDFEGAEKQYRKAMLLQPESVEVRELIRYMIVRKDRKERERAIRGRSPSPVNPPDRSLEKFSDRHRNKETSRTLKKLIQEDRSKHGDSNKRRRSAEQHFEERSHSRRHRSPESSSSSSSSGSSSSGSSSDSSSSSDSENSSAPRGHRQQRREKDRHRKGELDKEAGKYMNPVSSREDYQAELDRKSEAKIKIESPSEAFKVDHTSSFLFGADGNYRTTPPPEEKRKAEVKEPHKDGMTGKDKGTKDKRKEVSSKHKSKLHSKDKYKELSTKKSGENEETRSEKKVRRSWSRDRSSSRSQPKRKSREVYEDISDRDSKFDSSFETKHDHFSDRESQLDSSFESKPGHFSESGNDRVISKSDRKEKKIHDYKKGSEMKQGAFVDKDRKDHQKFGSKDGGRKYDSEDEYSADSKTKIAGKSSEKKLPPMKRERSRSSSAHSMDEREGSLSPGEHKRQYLQMKYERWKRATEIELERKRKQAQYNRTHFVKKPRGGKPDEIRNNKDKDQIQPRGRGSSRDHDSSLVMPNEEAIKSKWDSPGDGEGHIERRRKSRFDTMPQDKNQELDEKVFEKKIISEGKTNDVNLRVESEDGKNDMEKPKMMTDTERAQASRDLEGLRIHIKNDHFSDNKLSEDNIKGHSSRDSREGSITSSRGTHSSSRHRRPSPERRPSTDKNKHSLKEKDPKDGSKQSERTSSSSESSYESYHEDEVPDVSSGRYRKMEKIFKKEKGSSGSRDRHYSEGSKYKHLSDDYKKNKYFPRGSGHGGVDRGRGGYRGRNFHQRGQGKNQYRGRGKYRGSFKHNRDYENKKYNKDYHKSNKRSRSRSSSDSRSSRSASSSFSSSSSSRSPSRKKQSRYSPSRKGYSHGHKSWSSNRSPHTYVDPYDKGTPKFTRAKFPKVKQPVLGEIAMSIKQEPKVPPHPPPLTAQEELKKKEVLNQLESFLSHLKEKKKEQSASNDGSAVTPEKM